MADCIRYLIGQEDCSEVCIATGYWDIPGMSLIRPQLAAFLARGGKIRMIIGQEPIVREYQLAAERVQEIRNFPDDYIKLDVNDLSDDYKPDIELLFSYCTEGESQFEIRIFGQNLEPKQFMHAKCYIFRGPHAVGIIGSANFTKRGLEDNTELSYLESDSRIVSARVNADSADYGHVSWFEEKWALSVPWNKTFIKKILEPSPIGQRVKRSHAFKITPYAVYIKYLQNLFGTEVENSENGNSFLPGNADFKHLQYQIDAVNRGYSIMHTHNGLILADVVGLGKTSVALMLARKFLNTPELDGRTSNILVIVPPAVKGTWESEIAKFDQDNDGRLRNHITIVTTGKVVDFNELAEGNDADDDDAENTTLSLDDKQYGLIFVDESHKFRNSGTQMYQALDDLIARTLPQPYVVLLSATPQNNAPKDLKNQIYLFQRTPQNTTLETIDGRKLDSFFSKKQKEFDLAKKRKDYQTIKALSQEIRTKVLDQLVVRRTRTDIRQFYQSDASDLHFPEISGPHPLKYELNKKLSKLFFDTMNLIAPSDPESGDFVFNDAGLRYERYRAIEYLVSEEDRRRYQVRNLTPESTSRRLAKIMQILLVKRLESSFAAFKRSLGNLRRYTQNMVDMLNDDCVFICPDIDVNAELDTNEKGRSKKECYEALRALIQRKGGNNMEYRSSALSPEYKVRLLADLEKIESLCERWGSVSYDPKLQVFLRNLESELFAPDKNNPHHFDKPRLVIFTEAIDTLNQLEENISGQTEHHVLAVNSKNRDEMTKIIKANFDANAKPEEQRDDYDVLITTEVLAEGINLHRANVILNYDTPWNSTRLMQRIGRVNRIGSREDFVYVYNFMPTAEGDQQIELVNKAHSKLQAFHAMFGEDNQIFTTLEEVSSYGTDPTAMRALFEGEASPYEAYAAELREFKQTNPRYFNWIARQPDDFGAFRNGTDCFACVVKLASRSAGLNVLIQGDQPRDISTLEMIEFLKCAPDTPSLPIDDSVIAKYRDAALGYYTSFMTRMISASDGNAKRTAALGAIEKIKQQVEMASDTRLLLNIAANLIRENDAHLTRRIIRLGKEIDQACLPGMEVTSVDVETLIRDALRTIAGRTDAGRNLEPVVTLYMGFEGES